jgi:hypothetical protein
VAVGVAVFGIAVGNGRWVAAGGDCGTTVRELLADRLPPPLQAANIPIPIIINKHIAKIRLDLIMTQSIPLIS